MIIRSTDSNPKQTEQSREFLALLELRDAMAEVRLAEEKIEAGLGCCHECKGQIEKDLSCPCHPAAEREAA